MEAWTHTVLRASQTGCQQGSGGANGRQSPRPLADRELSRSEHCFAERLLCSAWASAAGRTLLAISAEPPYADPHVRWCGRGEWATTPPMPIGSPCLFRCVVSPITLTKNRFRIG